MKRTDKGDSDNRMRLAIDFIAYCPLVCLRNKMNAWEYSMMHEWNNRKEIQRQRRKIRRKQHQACETLRAMVERANQNEAIEKIVEVLP